MKKLILILFCCIFAVCALEGGSSIVIGDGNELMWSVITFASFLPLTAFLFYVLFVMFCKSYLFYRSSTRVYGEIIDLNVESVALGGGTWHPTIRYYTPEKEKILFVPDATLMFKPKKGKRLAIRILKDDCKVAELFKLRSGFFVCLAIACAATIILSRTFMYAVMSEQATLFSRCTVIICSCICILCFAFTAIP